jgi:hypothetical protein
MKKGIFAKYRTYTALRISMKHSKTTDQNEVDFTSEDSEKAKDTVKAILQQYGKTYVIDST